MKTIIYFVMLASLMILLFSSCAAPKPAARVSNPKVAVPTASAPVPPITAAEKQDNDIKHVKNVVSTRQGALQGIYRKQSAIQAMQGSLLIKLFIGDQGIIQSAEISVEEGTLSPEFIEAVRQEIITWRFMIRDKIVYSFKIQFNKR